MLEMFIISNKEQLCFVEAFFAHSLSDQLPGIYAVNLVIMICLGKKKYYCKKH